eukprot:scaffold112183_cov45-Phaeocystis_antarctica.AAC.1
MGGAEGSGGGDGGNGGDGGGAGRPMMLSALSFEPLRSVLARVASVKSMVGLSEVDEGVAEAAIGGELRAAQVGVGEVGLSEVDGGDAVVGVGSERRATQIGVGELGKLNIIKEIKPPKIICYMRTLLASSGSILGHGSATRTHRL